ncbi:uncharacterized protein LOC125238642 [Leguminivora glycinivorella]|uniref:uncharacterized protein LOC125238642 n=1 Tax=Leguminivora glycinivorella TaxID=1035111 RepID=UPI002010087B|nr:uncharacterized protein LOC125238642 [Leguminivora glycinivorella]
MASKKPPKTELVAICKLEFYRKQKNWKFCAQERKAKDSKKRTKSTNSKLNQTYNIASVVKKTDVKPEPKPVAAQPEPEAPEPELAVAEPEEQNLDEAFVEAETGTASESDEPAEGKDVLKDVLETETGKSTSQSEPPWISPRWSIQRWAERHRLWNPEPTHEPPCPTDPLCPTDLPCPAEPLCPTHNLKNIHPQQDINRPTYSQNYQDANCPIFDNNYNRLQQDLYSNQNFQYPNYPNYPYYAKHTEFDPKYASVFYYNSCYQELDVPYRGQSEPYRGHSEVYRGQSETFLPHDVNAGKEWDDREWCAGEGAAWSEPEWLAEALALGAGGPGGEDAVDGGWRHDLSSVSRCDSLPSVASSEFLRGAELAPHSTQIDLLLGPEPAAALTGAALVAAVARHTAALRGLLHEAQRRQQMCSKEAPSYDEIPVRDPGPDQYHLPLRFDDPIVASSYRPMPDLKGQTGQDRQGVGETGRGRGRLKVGIRMGRPYRL